MDPARLKSAYNRLENLDERLTHRIRPRPGGGLSRPTPDQIDQKMRDLAEYTIELKEVIHDLFHAVASAPSK